MDFIWKIAMESPDEEIANEAIQLIINYSYINLNPRLKKVSIQGKRLLRHKNVVLVVSQFDLFWYFVLTNVRIKCQSLILMYIYFLLLGLSVFT